MKTFKIGFYKNGQQVAQEVFSSENLEEVESEFKRMFNATAFCSEGTDNEADNAEEAWKFKRFSEDTNNVAVFEVEVYEALHTNYTYQCCTSTMIK